MSSYYDPDRVSKIGEIMPRFSAHVREGDHIHLGLQGDPLFPESYKSNRPTGVVTAVKSLDESKELTSIRVRMEDGATIDLHPGTLDPQRVWEFTDTSYNQVLERATRASQPAEDQPTYRGGGGGGPDELAELRRELADMRDSFEKEMHESRVFNNTLLATLNEMASDVCKSNADAKFCSVFVTEYGNMTKATQMKGGAEKASTNYFDSDLSADDDDDDDDAF